ncbi:hypothetical protein TPHA_0D00380 [Tetrapisispora phaffii CBS 4417]|uniref:BZIP domain-containing protein n=1 Tax=Tetrapisispora phaffii (strain ATCC 24235 / CBS 4417 / NBRC 1672 / NRRL Y-8282 / UCD 70-5) TaxID=1071381 RepID=G8BS61_TETPH|nr:hypothetical protein TPHA_0D00380 [Tetrapisispora phaffii CBS 4417]CCE62682.1 hypothetical protein TPHA_0D00380 [Tetrapisispora phaffii CBS 4417]
MTSAIAQNIHLLNSSPALVLNPASSPASSNETIDTKSLVNGIPSDFKSTLPPRKRAKTKEEKEQRRIERILRNRKAAHQSREKKRLHLLFLEKKCAILEKILAKIDNLDTFLEADKALLADFQALSEEGLQFQPSSNSVGTSSPVDDEPTEKLSKSISSEKKSTTKKVKKPTKSSNKHKIKLATVESNISPPSTILSSSNSDGNSLSDTGIFFKEEYDSPMMPEEDSLTSFTINRERLNTWDLQLTRSYSNNEHGTSSNIGSVHKRLGSHQNDKLKFMTKDDLVLSKGNTFKSSETNDESMDHLMNNRPSDYTPTLANNSTFKFKKIESDDFFLLSDDCSNNNYNDIADSFGNANKSPFFNDYQNTDQQALYL